MTSIQEKVREMRLRWYEPLQRLEKNNEVRTVVDMTVQEKDQGGDKQGEGMECEKFYLMGYFTASVIRLKYSVINLFQA